MTSNLGADVVRQRGKAIGFGRADAASPLDAADEQRVLDAAKKALPPELWGRVDEKCVFGPLGRTELARIAELLVHESSEQLFAERQIRYQVTDAVIDWVLDKAGLDPSLGARPLRRAVQRHCENAAARAGLKGAAQTGDHLVVEVGVDRQLGVYVAELDAAAPEPEPPWDPDEAAPTEG